MQILTLILEVALIIALCVVWWMARRDLLMLVTRQQTPALREMEGVQAAIEQLLERLEAQTEEAEHRIAARLDASRHSRDLDRPQETAARPPRSDPEPDPGANGAGAEPRYAEVYRLVDAGLDAEEIARRTGLGSGEVRLVISLRPS